MKYENYSVMVVGKNPENIIKKYYGEIKTIKYKYLDAKKLHSKEMNKLEGIIKNDSSEKVSEAIKKLKEIKDMSDFDYYRFLTKGMKYDENGNAYITENGKGKVLWHQKLDSNNPKLFELLNGEKSYQAKYEDIDWSKMHMNPDYVNYFTIVWEMVMDGMKPRNDIEKQVYDIMESRKNYFSEFETEEHFIKHNSCFWHFAYCDKDKWLDMDENGTNIDDWKENFYERFVSKLKNNDLITIYIYGK